MMSRRTILVAVGALMSLPVAAEAQRAAKVPRVGWLGGGGGLSGTEHRKSPQFKAFTEALREHGYIVGQNVLVDSRTVPPDKVEQYPDLATRFVAEGVDLIFAVNPYSIAAATKATITIPVVGIDLESDPVAQGWVATLARPGRNLTGVFLDIPEMSGKHIQFLKEVKPDLNRVAVLGDPRVNDLQFQATEAAARNAALSLQRFPVRRPDDIERAIAEASHQRAGALVALSSPLVNSTLKRIADRAVRHRLPAISTFVPRFAKVGGLLAYGPDFDDLYRRAAAYVGTILKGAKAGDLPVQRPEKFQLVINFKTANALGLTIPPSLLLRADHVIE